MILNSDNYKDIDKYYRGCFVKYPEFHGDKLFFAKKVTTEHIEGSHMDENNEEAPFLFYLNNEESKVNAEFILPQKSFFMHEEAAHILIRKPARQYKKGICDENTSVFMLGSDGDFYERSIDWRLLQSYVGKQKTYLFDMTGAQLSYPLSSRIAVSQSGAIFVDRVRIGSWSRPSLTVTLKNDVFVPELVAIIKASGQKIALVAAKEKIDV